MRKIIMLFSVLVVAGFVSVAVAAAKEQGKAGEALFKRHCFLCHPDGGRRSPTRTQKQLLNIS